MTIIINSLEILDANGTSLSDSIANFKKGSQSNYQEYLIDPVKNLIKFKINHSKFTITFSNYIPG